MNNPILFPYFENEYWWKFANVLSYMNAHSIMLEEDYINKGTDIDTWAGEWFSELLSDLYPFAIEYDEDDNMFIKQPIYDIFKLIEKRYSQHYVFKTRHEDADEAQAEAYKWTKKLFNVIEYTYKKYSKIIELYNDNYSTLMKQLENTTESGSRFNDTPQQKEVNLSFESNEYTTSLTKLKSVSRSDSDTPINKIEEIIRNYRNILLIWLDEFDGLFVKEGNV